MYQGQGAIIHLWKQEKLNKKQPVSQKMRRIGKQVKRLCDLVTVYRSELP